MDAPLRAQPWYQAARGLVQRRHGGATDEVGRPYVEHFLRVSQRLLERFPEASAAQVQAALLHDVFEPGGLDEHRLVSAGIDRAALPIVRAVTLPTDGRPYEDYVRALCATGNREALQVKLADNLDAIDLYTAIGDAVSLDLVTKRYQPARQAFERALGVDGREA